MPLTVTRTSGSAGNHEEEIDDLAVMVDDGEDLLRECAGGCGKKILSFGPPEGEDWGEKMDGALCIECLSKPLRHTPVGEP